jgi:hypothetical protein
MVLLEVAADGVSDDEPMVAQRFWKAVVKPLAPLAVIDVLLELELNACARLEEVDAMFWYCCTCFDACGD